MPVDYTVTIGLIRKRRRDLDNIGNVTLIAEGTDRETNADVPNDANCMIVSPGDTICWKLAKELSGTWEISHIPVGKGMGNIRDERTVDIFMGATDQSPASIPDNTDMRRIPPSIYDVRFMEIGNPTTIGDLPVTQGTRNSHASMSFTYRIYIKNQSNENDFWWIDPEIDICP